ncbi:MAG: dockerin type I repeat-containing protein, partial [Bacteroidaceae bacterium]|nr:dockerin type I repeat-containing protein [Bacteroidaceae bacterium]
YYLRTTDGKYASRGGDWNTRAMIDEFGLPMQLKANDDGTSEFIFVDNNLHLFDAGNGNVYTDSNNYPYWTIQAVTGGYNIKNANDNGTLNYYLSVQDGHLQSLEGAYVWTLETLAEHKTRMASLMDTQAATAATAAGITASTKSALVAALASGYREVAIDITGVDGIQEKYQAGAYSIDETVNGLEPGLYKLSVKAFCRMTRNADLDAAGGPASNVYLYAGDVKTQIASLFDAYSDVARVDGNDYQGADGKYYPNGLTAAGMAFNEGQYANDVYFYISSTTNLTFGITNPGRYGNDGSRGAWLAYRDFTLTRYEEGTTDINNDGQINFGDVQALIDIILHRDTTGYNTDAADIDGEGGVTIADVTALVNILLGR